MHSSSLARRFWVAAAAVAALLAGARVPAATLESLYEVSVPATSSGEQAAFRAGMRDVLVRVTGRRDAADLTSLAPLVDSASRYVTSYRRVAGGRYAVSFDAAAIETAVAAAGLPFWGEDRPATLVWLAVDRGSGQRGLVTAEAASSERRVVEAAAEQRGLPLLWPTTATGEDARSRFEQAWSGDTAGLAAAAARYGADGVLVGRATAAGAGRYSVDWTFVGAGGDAQVRGELGEGVHLAADRYAALFASAEAGRRSEFDVVVQGVTTAPQYADLSRYLGSLDVVRGLRLSRVLPDAVVFHVATRGGVEALRRELEGGGRLRPVDASAASPTYAWQP
jgi:hypothetical protein